MFKLPFLIVHMIFFFFLIVSYYFSYILLLHPIHDFVSVYYLKIKWSVLLRQYDFKPASKLAVQTVHLATQHLNSCYLSNHGRTKK